jgi:hypothetical protein
MLRLLHGKTHAVYSGIDPRRSGKRRREFRR